jgi:hypothetical protein
MYLMAEIIIQLSESDTKDFLEWCERLGLSPDEGCSHLLAMTRRDRNLGQLFDDDEFPSAFRAAKGKIDRDIDLE